MNIGIATVPIISIRGTAIKLRTQPTKNAKGYIVITTRTLNNMLIS